jgi:hypothetical protein
VITDLSSIWFLLVCLARLSIYYLTVMSNVTAIFFLAEQRVHLVEFRGVIHGHIKSGLVRVCE